jgi:DNA mismatch endonuclease (patch repair protein)
MDLLTKTQRSLLMSRVRQRGTALELRLRSALRARRLRYRTNVSLPGTPDIAIGTGKLAVFVDGCFWHGCPRHGTMPKTNRAFWRRKIVRNRERDSEVDRELRKLGWRPVRVWEHELRTSVDSVVERLSALVAQAARRTGRRKAPIGPMLRTVMSRGGSLSPSGKAAHPSAPRSAPTRPYD